MKGWKKQHLQFTLKYEEKPPEMSILISIIRRNWTQRGTVSGLG